MTVQGHEYRVYFEEAGSGIPLVLMHTAGTDGRLYRHLLEDPEITRDFRLIAPDSPYHGKSLPPVTKEWWAEEYKLTTSFLFDFMLGLNAELEAPPPRLHGRVDGRAPRGRPRDQPPRALPGGDRPGGGSGHRADRAGEAARVVRSADRNEMKAALMHTMMSPTSPENLRREVDFIYSQGAPAAFKGDLNYYGVEHDVTETARTIDTQVCAMYILGGEYDWSGTPAVCRALHDAVPGSHYTLMEGLGHFPMSENPDRFKSFLTPLLDDIRARLA